MEVIDGIFYMAGCNDNDPSCIHTANELLKLIQKIGFLPLFANEIQGFSVEERTAVSGWWSGDAEADPWMWRQILSSNDEIAYGKFFNKKAGYVSKKWFPVFANYRRNGYDFEALVGDELASHRAQKIMNAFELNDELEGLELLSNELKEKAGFGKNGEKNFDGVLTELQMQSYLLMSDFRQRTNKKGQPYGWHIAAMETPETKWGYDHIAKGYQEEPEKSWQRIVKQVRVICPDADDADIIKVMGIRHPGQAVKKRPAKRKSPADLPYPENLIVSLGIPKKYWDGIYLPLDADQMEGLNFVLSEISEVQRIVLQCRYEHHMSYDEIAEKFGTSKSNVMTIHGKVMRRLQSSKWLPYIRDGYCKVLMGQYEKDEELKKAVEGEMDEIRKESGIQDLSAIRISEIGVPARIVNALHRDNVDTFEDLLRLMFTDRQKFIRIRNLGEGSRQQLFDKLEEYGIYLERC